MTSEAEDAVAPWAGQASSCARSVHARMRVRAGHVDGACGEDGVRSTYTIPRRVVSTSSGSASFPGASRGKEWDEMSYRAVLQVNPESVQDLEVSARRRLDEAAFLLMDGQHHSSIYLAGLSAEMRVVSGEGRSRKVR